MHSNHSSYAPSTAHYIDNSIVPCYTKNTRGVALVTRPPSDATAIKAVGWQVKIKITRLPICRGAGYFLLLWLIINMTNVANANITINASYVVTASPPLQEAQPTALCNYIRYNYTI